MKNNQASEDFKKEYETLKHYLITPIWDKNGYYEWLEEEYNLIFSFNVKEKINSYQWMTTFYLDIFISKTLFLLCFIFKICQYYLFVLR